MSLSKDENDSELKSVPLLYSPLSTLSFSLFLSLRYANVLSRKIGGNKVS